MRRNSRYINKLDYHLVILLLALVSCVSAYMGLRLLADKVRAANEFASPLPSAKLVEIEIPKYIEKEVYVLPQNVVDFIEMLWGDEAGDAIKVFTCESRLNPSVEHWNNNGSVDTGVAQINSVHGINQKWLRDYRINLLVAYKLWQEQGWRPWVCDYVLE